MAASRTWTDEALRRVPYDPGMIDYFSIVVEGGGLYLIPFDVVEGKQAIVLDYKYAAFAVS